jgi:hypothetical protein
MPRPPSPSTSRLGRSIRIGPECVSGLDQASPGLELGPDRLAPRTIHGTPRSAAPNADGWRRPRALAASALPTGRRSQAGRSPFRHWSRRRPPW